MIMNFSNQIVWITGASRGIGAAVAEYFAKQGAHVIGTATTETGAQQITKHLHPYGKGLGVLLDVTHSTQCQEVFSELITRYGAPQILVNNAGITRDNLLLRMTETEWTQVIDVHLNGLFRLCKLAIKPMLKAHYGRIINISSAVACTGNPGQVNYVAAKAGMIGFSKALAREVASRGITVNVVAPGFIETTMTAALNATQKQNILDSIPTRTIGTPADIARAVLFLADPDSTYITGQTLHVNGGLYCGD
jgi:3-oxoacyl-[acyl-carrier protein] reductase